MQDSAAMDRLICLGHLGLEDDNGGAMAPPIVQTSLFAKSTFQDLTDGLAAEHMHPVYTRGQNPTVEALEHKLARLERGEACKAFASGMAAIAAVFFGLLKQGDHVVFVNQIYGPALQLMRRFEGLGVTHSCVLSGHLDEVAAALRPETRLIYCESPGTMLFRLLDVPALAQLAQQRGILTVLDNSWATPLFQKPLTQGIDLVVHSATKYLGGHSDVVAGALIGSQELIQRLFYDAYLLLGGTLGPQDAWLVHRGLRTLPVRMKQHCEAGLTVARFLDQHPNVRQVFHPALQEEDRALAERQLTGTSGVFSFQLTKDASEDVAAEEVAAFLDRLQLFRLGVSWGGVESLAISPDRPDNRQQLMAEGLVPGLVRLSVGLEGADALIDDLEQALSGVGSP